jgi:hypothetical protein
MNKLKNYSILVFVGFILILAVMNYFKDRKIERQNAEIFRLANNQNELLDQNNHHVDLILKKDEFIKNLDDSLKQALKELKIKPKTVVKVEERTVTIRDTIVKEVPVYVLKRDTWLISDSDKCFIWEGIASLTHDSLNVRRINFSYQNKTTDIFTATRPKKFLFIRYGRKVITQTSQSKCGKETSRVITIK